MTAQTPKKEALDEKLSYYVDNEDQIGVIVYAVVRDNPVALKMDIEGSAQAGLKKLFLESISADIITNENIQILPLSSADERKSVIYHYDIPLPAELNAFNSELGQPGVVNFNFNVNKLSDIKVLIIVLGNAQRKIVLYKNVAPVNIFSRSGFFLKKSNTRLEEIKDDFFRLTGNFQIMKVDGEIYVLDLTLIEKMFGFHEVIKREAVSGMEAIRDKGILTNVDIIRDLIEDVKYARKLTKVAKSSPVIKFEIGNDKIIQFCKTYPLLKGRIRFNEDQTMISLDTKVSQDLFIKLLMDDLLTSQLTEFYYESIAKDAVPVNSQD